MKLCVTRTTEEEVAFLKVIATVRYWDDAQVNGDEDSIGSLIPLRVGNEWCPTIELATGRILDWPIGTTAKVHYKVCDEGEYSLLDAQMMAVAERVNEYVPDGLLCVGDRGYGDYIVLTIDADGFIVGWDPDPIDPDEWIACEAPTAAEAKASPSDANAERATVDEAMKERAWKAFVLCHCVEDSSTYSEAMEDGVVDLDGTFVEKSDIAAALTAALTPATGEEG